MSKSYQPINLDALPRPAAIEVIKYEAILETRRAELIALWPADERPEIAQRMALDSDPLTKLLQENAYRETILRQRINDAALATMLAYAKDEDLDQVAAATNTKRLVVVPATKDAPAVTESDDSLRERAQLAWEGLSTAGPRSSYVYHALSASGQVADAECVSPSPAVVDLVVLSSEGDGTASEQLLNTVFEYVNDDDVRPIADRLTVLSAEIINYTIDAKIYLSTVGGESEIIMQAARASLDEHLEKSRRIGVEVTESAIHAALHVTGVAKVELIDWTDIQVSSYQSAYCTDVTLELTI